jgi:hypothetical protein
MGKKLTTVIENQNTMGKKLTTVIETQDTMAKNQETMGKKLTTVLNTVNSLKGLPKTTGAIAEWQTLMERVVSGTDKQLRQPQLVTSGGHQAAVEPAAAASAATADHARVSRLRLRRCCGRCVLSSPHCSLHALARLPPGPLAVLCDRTTMPHLVGR